MRRYIDAAVIADHLAQASPGHLGITPDHRQRLLERYLVVLRRTDWSDTARAGVDPDNDFFAWFAETIAVRLRLPAFIEPDAT
jgi:hypothetical protein